MCMCLCVLKGGGGDVRQTEVCCNLLLQGLFGVN